MQNIAVGDLLILLVEPSTTQQRVISGYLQQLGVNNIDMVGSGEDALANMRQAAPDLTISSMYLPDMTGTELVERMRSEESMLDIPYMLISSETNVRLLEPIRQAGVIAILPKPFELENLRDALLSAIDVLDPDSMKLDEYVAEMVKVLLVDDSATSRHHISRVLNNMGINKITEASNGREGIELMREAEFDLIVTDYNMPEVDGEEFVRYVRQQSSQPGVPILMVTSMKDDARLAQVEQEGVSAICDKPFEPRQMMDMLQRIL